MSLAKEKDLFKKRTYLFTCLQDRHFPTCHRMFLENDQAFSPSSYFFLCREVVFFRVRPRIMIGLETVLRVFEIS